MTREMWTGWLDRIIIISLLVPIIVLTGTGIVFMKFFIGKPLLLCFNIRDQPGWTGATDRL